MLIHLYRKINLKNDTFHSQPFSDYGYKIAIFKPSFFKQGLDKSERIKRLLWFLITKGRYRILYVLDGEKVIHYTFIIPKNFRFPFMSHEDLQIGPCFTDINYRNRGIYSKVLRIIPDLFKESSGTFWIYTTEDNIISQKVIEREGFQFHGFRRITALLKILKITSNT